MREILFANLCLALAGVKIVITIRQAKAALSRAGDLLGRILVILLHAEAEQRRGGILRVQAGDEGGNALLVLESGNLSSAG